MYSFFYNNPDKIFNYGTFDTISIFPVIPVIGLITFSIGYTYIFNFRPSKSKIILIGTSVGITTFIIFQLGNIEEILFAVIFVPLLIISILNFKKIQENFVLMVIVSLTFLVIVSISNLSRAYQFFPMWLIIPAVNAVFFVEVLPMILNKLGIHKNHTKILVTIIVIIIILNVTASFVFTNIMSYPHEFSGISNEIQTIFSNESFNPQGYKAKMIGEILSYEKDIETSYIMASSGGYSYHAGSKWIIVSFTEGKEGDSIQDYINRKNWSEYDLYMSNIGSFPPDTHKIINPIPDYIIYEKIEEEMSDYIGINSTQYQDLSILLEPESPNIPHNFELIWNSENFDTVVYRINK